MSFATPNRVVSVLCPVPQVHWDCIGYCLGDGRDVFEEQSFQEQKQTTAHGTVVLQVFSSDGIFNEGLTIAVLKSRGAMPVKRDMLMMFMNVFEDSKCNFKSLGERSINCFRSICLEFAAYHSAKSPLAILFISFNQHHHLHD